MAISPDTIALVHQVSLESTELYIQDLRTNSAAPALHSRFMPTHIALLPTGDGFSFLDNGIVRIKYFHKRSPKSIEFSSPLRAINSMVWGTNMHMYISAKYLDHYGLYDATINGDVQRILSREHTDFLFPQKINNHLFFIARSINQDIYSYAIAKVNHFKAETERVIADFGNQPIAFLAMDTDSKGFVVTHPPYLSAHSENVLFSYYCIFEDKNVPSQENLDNYRGWHVQKLFDFSIPTKLLVTNNQSGLFEHIFPKKYDNDIFFSHAINGTLVLFKYSLLSGQYYQMTTCRSPEDHAFSPLKVGNIIYYSGNGNIIRHLLPQSTSAIARHSHL